MPRAQVQVLPAETKTRWTLSRHDDDAAAIHSPKGGEEWAKMAANGNGFYYDSNRDQSLPRYESSYDGSQYSSHSPRMSAQGGYRPPESVSNYDGFDFATGPLDDRRSQRISVNTKVRPQQHHHHQNQDVVSKHLLYETALMDSQTFEILDIAEVDALKKEHVRLNSRIEAAQRKLTLESKVRDAAQNLQRLYSTNKRPDTPQSPESPKKNRRSLMPGRDRSPSINVETAGQADSELQASVKKVDELHEQVKSLFDRRQYVERKLLRHTAAVLAEEANKNVESAVPGLANGHHGFGDDDDDAYTPNEFDGIRDILRGMPAGASNKVQQHEQQLASMQERLEKLNSQLRSVISEADQTLGNKIPAELPLDQSEDSSVRVENRIARLEDSVQTLEQQHFDLQSHHAEIKGGLQSQHTQIQNDMEQQLGELNATLHKAILVASEAQPVPGLQDPPQVSGQGYHDQIDYMEESLMTIEQLVQQQNQNVSNSVGLSKKLEEYDNTISGLWDILQSDVAASPKPAFQEDEDDLPPTPRTPFIESFSLQAFSSRVQNLFDRAQAAKEQQDILLRQIQQQRELNEKSDGEKDRQIADLTTNHDALSQEHSAIQQELANYIVKHEQIESEAGHSRNELQNVMTELEEMKKTMDAKQLEREDAASKMREHIELLQKQVSEGVEQQQEMESLESEVVRLTTELTMAKAELDGAYGTRAERKGAQAGQVAQLERELSEMTNELQELTKESIELEKEREQLDALIDSLRDRCDSLESQLADEKLRSVGVGIRSPTAAGFEGSRETTSMMVLRQEFKKMMREQRAEGLKLLRGEQEERRKLEAELRKLRQANGPLAKNLQSSSGTSTPVRPAD